MLALNGNTLTDEIPFGAGCDGDTKALRDLKSAEGRKLEKGLRAWRYAITEAGSRRSPTIADLKPSVWRSTRSGVRKSCYCSCVVR